MKKLIDKIDNASDLDEKIRLLEALKKSSYVLFETL